MVQLQEAQMTKHQPARKTFKADLDSLVKTYASRATPIEAEDMVLDLECAMNDLAQEFGLA